MSLFNQAVANNKQPIIVTYNLRCQPISFKILCSLYLVITILATGVSELAIGKEPTLYPHLNNDWIDSMRNSQSTKNQFANEQSNPNQPNTNQTNTNQTNTNQTSVEKKIPEEILENQPGTNPISKEQSEQHEYLIYHLLLANMAAQRKIPDVALREFLMLAKKTENPAIAKEATEWAVEYQMPEEAQIAAELWAKSAQDDLQAQLVATTLVIGKSINQAIPYLTRSIELQPKEVAQHILDIQTRLSARSAGHLKLALFQIATTHPNNAYMNLIAAQSAAQQEDIKNSNRYVDIALNLIPNLTPGLELKARLIRYEDSTDTRALSYLKNNLQKFPENRELRLFYASALVDANQLKEAIFHLKKLADDKELGGQAVLYLGEVYRKQGDYKNANEFWKMALKHPDTADNAEYLLGQLAELQGKVDEAVNWFTKIESGSFHVAAQLRAAELLKRAKKFDEAIHILHDSSPTTLEEQKQLIIAEIDVLIANKRLNDAMNLADEVLNKIPTDEDLLLAHSLVAIKLKNWKVAEKDLKTVLEQNPSNGDALNTLGFILSQQPERRKEAKQFLERALSIAPNNPSYLDSLGWFYFMEGDLNQAAVYLKKAHELSNDPEIAAHLGEVLWQLGRQEDAKIIWAKALSKAPQDEKLLDTLGRFRVQLNTPNKK